ncbi:RES family NAD+ phosphorylase [Roseomonas sp. CECT 9278]|uniref:RES family NAD+ phosphorylase n=1 Tax=Roseomonas sp. CECT 9278 TaxID=2845823 RepID=UPI001E2E6C71|nr:RES family NAD+ phosphorylase [Roseomonas sp. CECT 9278]CAH0305391.1 hypothetical protein ROS9278_04706 [Roseomonas sp. CECT 9278]
MTDRRARARPPRAAATLRLATTTLPAGTRRFRFVRRAHPDALGTGPGPSRFSDPAADRGRAARWRPIYLGATFSLCLQETLLRDRANAAPGPFLVAQAELALWDCAEIEVTRPLRLVDLRGAALARSRVPTDVVGAASHALSRAWATAFWRHPARHAGVAFPSRFGTGENLALFEARVAGALRVVQRRGVLACEAELGAACEALDLGIIGAAR